MQTLSVTLIQSNLFWEDIQANLDMFSKKIEAIKDSTDLIVLPEMFSTGFTMNAATLAEETNNSTAVAWMRKMAVQKNCAITGSLVLRDNAENERVFFNRLIWMNADGSFSYYDKRHLFSLSKEEEVYTPGDNRLIVELKGWKICPLICYDLRFPAWSRNALDDNGEPVYDLLLYVANWPERRIYAWKQLLVARAIENQSYVIGLNRIGNDGNDIYHSGDSLVLDPLGKMLYHKEQAEDIATVQLDMDELRSVRSTFRFLKDADPFVIDSRNQIKSH